MATEWFTRVGSVTAGPHTTAELKARAADGRLPPDGRVRRGDDGPWVRADGVGGLTFPDPPEDDADEPDDGPDEPRPARLRYPTLRTIATLARVFAVLCGGLAGVAALLGLYRVASADWAADRIVGASVFTGAAVWGTVFVIGFLVLAEGISLAIDAEHTLREIRDRLPARGRD